MKKVSVLGGGSWGTALAYVLASAGHRVAVHSRNKEVVAAIQNTRTNPYYHADIQLPESIRASDNLDTVLDQTEAIVLAIPSYATREILPILSKTLEKSRVPLISTAKGIEVNSRMTCEAVVREVLGREIREKQYSVLSGPSFAHEVILGHPTALTAASDSTEVSKFVQDLFHTETFRVFTSDDVIGVEIAGALKNVIAIAAGASDGLGFGHNSRAGLITRGLAEISRIGIPLGAHPLTFSGLAGLGDLILTCTGDLSRNRRVGMKLAQGFTMKEILRDLGQVAEGIRTAKAAFILAQELGVDVPIIEETYRAIHEGKDPRQALKDLLARSPKEERG